MAGGCRLNSANLGKNRPKTQNLGLVRPLLRGPPGPTLEISKRFECTSLCYVIIHHETAFGAKNFPNNKILRLGKLSSRSCEPAKTERKTTPYCLF